MELAAASVAVGCADVSTAPMVGLGPMQPHRLAAAMSERNGRVDMVLRSFLSDAGKTPFAWGVHDCCLIIADWWLAVHGVDPAADIRGTYATKEECHALLDREGGMRALIERYATAVGAERVSTPKAGDFGLVTLATGGEVAAIMASDGKWAAKSERGLVAFRHASIEAAWSI